jgi:hypothetical protein
MVSHAAAGETALHRRGTAQAAELFPLIRSLVDEWEDNGYVLVLGSASRDLLQETFMVAIVPSFLANTDKRLVKTPKV